MNISWEKLTLEEARGFVTGYTVMHYSLEESHRVVREVVQSDSSYKVIDNLEFTGSYSVTVSASTSAGEGTSSPEIISRGKPAGS
jgi:hypothetical protein